MQPTEQEKAIVISALQAARQGAGTLTMLAQAHEIAAKYGMTEALKEIRRQIYALLPHPGPSLFNRKTIFYSIVLGLISALVTSFIFSKTRLKERLGLEEAKGE